MQRVVERIVTAVTTLEGGGFQVHRPFPTGDLDMLDPFLLLDEMGPSAHAPGEAKGAPDHPHRGFETVTYLLEGEMEHADSKGNRGKLGPGDVQWMTAGAGVIHSELPSKEFLARGGTMHGFQLWVNLPKEAKMSPPRYQELKRDAIPVVERDGAVVTVIAGEAAGAKAIVSTYIPILYLHVRLAPRAAFEQEIEGDRSAFAYVFRGAVHIGGTPVGAQRMAILGEGSIARIESLGASSELLVIAGAPIREPVARYGPFVMNDRAEILQALEDFENGRF
jgi:quercetin 2,3-dioxygenase